MRFLFLLPVALGALFAQEAAHLSVSVNLVNVSFSARNARGAFVNGLRQTDFQAFQDGQPQRIKFFSQSESLPLTIGLLMDFSGSQKKFIGRHGADARQFLLHILRKEDRAFLVCFDANARLAAGLGASPQAIAEAIDDFPLHPGAYPLLGADLNPYEQAGHGGTAVHDALYFALTETMRGVRGRKALIILSDGEDNASEHSLQDAIHAAQDTDTLLYSIRYTDFHRNLLSDANLHGMKEMNVLADETGGRAFDTNQIKVSKAFDEIEAELRSLYELAYTSEDAGANTFHKIQIRANDPALAIRARDGYLSAP